MPGRPQGQKAVSFWQETYFKTGCKRRQKEQKELSGISQKLFYIWFSDGRELYKSIYIFKEWNS